MKRRILIKYFESSGWYLKKEGGNHTIYEKIFDDGTRAIEQIPRHREVNEKLAKALIKKWKLDKE